MKHYLDKNKRNTEQTMLAMKLICIILLICYAMHHIFKFIFHTLPNIKHG